MSSPWSKPPAAPGPRSGGRGAAARSASSRRRSGSGRRGGERLADLAADFGRGPGCSEGSGCGGQAPGGGDQLVEGGVDPAGPRVDGRAQVAQVGADQLCEWRYSMISRGTLVRGCPVFLRRQLLQHLDVGGAAGLGPLAGGEASLSKSTSANWRVGSRWNASPASRVDLLPQLVTPARPAHRPGAAARPGRR